MSEVRKRLAAKDGQHHHLDSSKENISYNKNIIMNEERY